ncbi:hypothetical protein AB0B88_16145 [Micromonospora haikouensis]|uniref:hypothetical protein n=1 Tax=Micromonospora haikouensis TaxID=686309 RepID=UPI0033F66120
MSIKAVMSDKQYRAMSEVMQREGTEVVRFVDAPVTTLLAMERRGWVNLTYGVVDGRRGIVSATIRHPGRTAYESETRRREILAADAATMAKALGQPAAYTPPPATARRARRSITAQVDPFALFARPRELAIPF